MPRMANTYQIQRGDTLSKIAVLHHTTVDEVLSLNPEIKNPNLIFAGTIIKVPVKAPETHSVPLNNVLQEIAKAYCTSPDELLSVKPEFINTGVVATGAQPVVPIRDLRDDVQQLPDPKECVEEAPVDGKSDCTPREFVDVVFIPHKGEWRALTKEAKEKFDAEDEKLRNAIRPLRSEEHTSELQSRENLVCRLLLEKKKNKY